MHDNDISLVVDVADERDNEFYALSPDVLTTAIPSMLTLKVKVLDIVYSNNIIIG